MILRIILLASLVAGLTGCFHLTPQQRDLYEEAVLSGGPTCSWPSPLLSGALSILPGGGQFANGQVGLGIVNALFWPLSYLWAIPSGIVDAERIRRARTADLYYERRKDPSSE